MSLEMENIWEAMKDVHYQRTIEQLEGSIQNSRRLEEALTTALDLVVTAVHAVAGTFWFYDQYGSGRIHPKAVYGGGDLGGISLLPGEGIAGEVIQDGQSVIIPNCQKDPRWAGKVDAKTGFKTESMICVPLSLKEVAFGCIQIINKTDHMAFDSKDLAFAEELAKTTAMLFQRQGLLDDYFPKDAFTSHPEEVGFLQVFAAEDDRKMESQLRQVKEFAQLRISEQEEVLRLAREMRKFFGGNSVGKARRLFWK